jgi:E3 ubiquitin ligase
MVERFVALRRLYEAPAYRIGELPENTTGAITGMAALLDAHLESPLTKRDCLYYIIKVDRRRWDGSWKTIILEEAGVPFALVDTSGRAIVDPTHAEVALVFDPANCSHRRSKIAGPAEREFLARRGHTSVWSFIRQLRYSEALLRAGTKIAVLGSGVREGDPAATPRDGYRSDPRTLVRLTSSAKYPLLICDDESTSTPR